MIKSNGFAAVMLTALLTTLAAADDGARKLTSGERIVIAESAAWGVVNTLHDGSLGLVIQRARTLQDIDGPMSRWSGYVRPTAAGPGRIPC